MASSHAEPGSGSRLRGAALALAGCAGGVGLDRLAADRSLVTGSVAAAAAAPRNAEASDKAAIGDTVAVMAVRRHARRHAFPGPTSTPARPGRSPRSSDRAEDGGLCRRFTATRESFEGASSYRGEACRDASGPWSLESLDKL